MIDRKSLTTVAVAAVVAAALALAVRDSLRAPAAVHPFPADVRTGASGKAAPDLPKLVELKGGGTRDLGKPPGDRILVLHFWATWCAPCVDEFPGVVAFWKKFRSNPKVELLTVSVDDDWPVVEAWLKKSGGAGIPVALDPKRLTAKAFGTEKFPETYVITADGAVLERYEGPIDWASPGFRQQIADFAAVAGKPLRVPKG
jgi:thiol-disulfide isomerase/thioredoxin